MGVGWVPGWVGSPSDSLSLKTWTLDSGLRTSNLDSGLSILELPQWCRGDLNAILFLTPQKTMICYCSAISVELSNTGKLGRSGYWTLNKVREGQIVNDMMTTLITLCATERGVTWGEGTRTTALLSLKSARRRKLMTVTKTGVDHNHSCLYICLTYYTIEH